LVLVTVGVAGLSAADRRRSLADERSQSAHGGLATRDYALQREDLILQVLTSSSDAWHRVIAAQMLGYGRRSDQQIDALVHAQPRRGGWCA
jgi:hypothetical protein